MRGRRDLAAALVPALAACQPIFYDLFDSAGPATTTPGPVSESMSDPTAPDPTGDPTSGATEGASDSDPRPPRPACDDGERNGLETGVDCGGPLCPPCFPGECFGPEDCETQICVDGKCLPPQCEFAKDCPQEDPCIAPVCEPRTRQCTYVPLDGIPCEDGDLCSVEDMCHGGACQPGPPALCEQQVPCQLGFCNPNTGNCAVEFIDDGMPCEDGFACTTDEMCVQGQCVGKPMPPLFFEDFSAPQGWMVDEWWQIGPAVPSQCAELGSEDPPEDHTPGPDEMLAGALIGGCLPSKPLAQDVCLTSPPIDATFPGPLWLTFHSRLSSPPAPAEARVEVWNGQQWAPVFTTKGEPIDEPGWTEHLHEITPFKNPKLRVRFCHHHPVEGLPVVAGWSVDDVALGLPGCFPP